MSTSRRSLRQETRTPPAGSGAKVLDASALELLGAYGVAFQSAVRETYRRCVLIGEPWFVAGRHDAHAGGVRSQLIARDWSLMQTAIEAAVSEFLGRIAPLSDLQTSLRRHNGPPGMDVGRSRDRLLAHARAAARAQSARCST